MRIAAADVRRILLERAATELGADAAQLAAEDGTVTAPDGRTAAYWDPVADGVLEVEATGQGTPKTPDQYSLVGQPVPRLDIPAIMTGQAIFIQNLRPEGMVHGRMVYPPSYGATLTSLDAGPVEAMPGILAVVREGNFFGVVAEREDQAEAAAVMLGTLSQWQERETMPGMDEFHAWLTAQETDDVVHLDTVRSDQRPAAQTPPGRIPAPLPHARVPRDLLRARHLRRGRRHDDRAEPQTERLVYRRSHRPARRPRGGERPPPTRAGLWLLRPQHGMIDR
jgi:hypothetical protein